MDLFRLVSMIHWHWVMYELHLIIVTHSVLSDVINQNGQQQTVFFSHVKYVMNLCMNGLLVS